jgi:hypothetical protein
MEADGKLSEILIIYIFSYIFRKKQRHVPASNG